MRFVTTSILGSVLVLGGCGSDSSSGTGGSGGSGASPTITMVAWETVPSCERNDRTDYTVTVSASDPDTSEADLAFSGSVGGCEGRIDGATSTISCPNVAPYPGTVMATDDDGNESTPVAFEIDVCETSSCTTDPNTCG